MLENTYGASAVEESPGSGGVDGAFSLRLTRLRLALCLGCSAEERATEQEVEVSVSVHFAAEPAACRTDHLTDTVCLAAVAERLRALATATSYALIEHLAFRLHRSVVELCPPGSAIELEVRKLAPPIPGLEGGTSFCIRSAKEEQLPDAGAPGQDPRARLERNDHAVFEAIRGEEQRQADSIELIPSENYTHPEVLAALGSVLTDKYAEGYPGRRYYGGSTFADQVEELARARARELFRAEHANVQPLSGSPMNQAVYFALLRPGDAILAMDLTHGGHLTHGAPVSHMGRIFRFARYRTEPDGRIDYDALLRLARETRPKLLLCGHSSYPREFDYAQFRRIADDVGALLMADISHVGGLIAGGALQNPLDHGFDVLTTTTHKTLRGPRAGLILCKSRHASAIDRSVFPGLQGGPHMNTIAAVAVALGKAQEAGFSRYAAAVLDNAQALAQVLCERGVRLVSGGTQNHLVVLDTLQSFGVDGARSEQVLEQAGITCNRQLVPDDPHPPLTPSGIRIGTPAVTTRGMGRDEMAQLGHWIVDCLSHLNDTQGLASVRGRCADLCARFPIPGRSKEPTGPAPSGGPRERRWC
jgi:glycine hydroxymethyltransferase